MPVREFESLPNSDASRFSWPHSVKSFAFILYEPFTCSPSPLRLQDPRPDGKPFAL